MYKPENPLLASKNNLSYFLIVIWNTGLLKVQFWNIPLLVLFLSNICIYWSISLSLSSWQFSSWISVTLSCIVVFNCEVLACCCCPCPGNDWGCTKPTSNVCCASIGYSLLSFTLCTISWKLFLNKALLTVSALFLHLMLYANSVSV